MKAIEYILAGVALWCLDWLVVSAIDRIRECKRRRRHRRSVRRRWQSNHAGTYPHNN